jgi:hypothetical protein
MWQDPLAGAQQFSIESNAFTDLEGCGDCPLKLPRLGYCWYVIADKFLNSPTVHTLTLEKGESLSFLKIVKFVIKTWKNIYKKELETATKKEWMHYENNMTIMAKLPPRDWWLNNDRPATDGKYKISHVDLEDITFVTFVYFPTTGEIMANYYY